MCVGSGFQASGLARCKHRNARAHAVAEKKLSIKIYRVSRMKHQKEQAYMMLREDTEDSGSLRTFERGIIVRRLRGTTSKKVLKNKGEFQ